MSQRRQRSTARAGAPNYAEEEYYSAAEESDLNSSSEVESARSESRTLVPRAPIVEVIGNSADAYTPKALGRLDLGSTNTVVFTVKEWQEYLCSVRGKIGSAIEALALIKAIIAWVSRNKSIDAIRLFRTSTKVKVNNALIEPWMKMLGDADSPFFDQLKQREAVNRELGGKIGKGLLARYATNYWNWTSLDLNSNFPEFCTFLAVAVHVLYTVKEPEENVPSGAVHHEIRKVFEDYISTSFPACHEPEIRFEGDLNFLGLEASIFPGARHKGAFEMPVTGLDASTLTQAGQPIKSNWMYAEDLNTRHREESEELKKSHKRLTHYLVSALHEAREFAMKAERFTPLHDEWLEIGGNIRPESGGDYLENDEELKKLLELKSTDRGFFEGVMQNIREKIAEVPAPKTNAVAASITLNSTSRPAVFGPSIPFKTSEATTRAILSSSSSTPPRPSKPGLSASKSSYESDIDLAAEQIKEKGRKRFLPSAKQQSRSKKLITGQPDKKQQDSNPKEPENEPDAENGEDQDSGPKEPEGKPTPENETEQDSGLKEPEGEFNAEYKADQGSGPSNPPRKPKRAPRKPKRYE